MDNQIKSLLRAIKINNLFLILFLGVILNMSVIVFNDSRMPVYFTEENFKRGILVDDSTHKIFTNFEDINYPYLSDIIPISIGRFWIKFSVGDILIWGSSILIIFLTISDSIKMRREDGITINS